MKVALGEAPLTILLDVRNPASYLALGPAIAFGRDLDLEIDWLPLSVPPLRAPTEAGPDDDRGIVHRRHRARAIAREIETYALAQGLVMRDYYRDGDAGAGHAAWLWVREHDPAVLPRFLEALFRRYWALALDPSKSDDVSRVVDEVGLDVAACAAWSTSEGPDALASVSEALRELGVFQVPAYLVGDEVFYGRQHLAMIRFVLEGRSGRGPI